MDLNASYPLLVFLIILGAGVCVTMAYAVGRLVSKDEYVNVYQISPAQEQYMSDVRARNRDRIWEEAGMGRYYVPRAKSQGRK